MSERWLTVAEATDTIRAHVRSSIGRTEAILKAARSSGEIRSLGGEPLVLADDGIVGLGVRPGRPQVIIAPEVALSEDDLIDWLTQKHGPSRAPGRNSKGGRPRKFDPAAVAAEVVRLMEHHGEFSQDDPEWNAQARLVDSIIKKFGEAAESTVEEYIKEPLAAWRARSPKT